VRGAEQRRARCVAERVRFALPPDNRCALTTSRPDADLASAISWLATAGSYQTIARRG
jgi:hypothetical protein